MLKKIIYYLSLVFIVIAFPAVFIIFLIYVSLVGDKIKYITPTEEQETEKSKLQ